MMATVWSDSLIDSVDVVCLKAIFIAMHVNKSLVGVSASQLHKFNDNFCCSQNFLIQVHKHITLTKPHLYSVKFVYSTYIIAASIIMVNSSTICF